MEEDRPGILTWWGIAFGLIFVIVALLLRLHANSITQAQTAQTNSEALQQCLAAAQPQYSKDDLTTLALYQPASYRAVLQAQQNAEATCRATYTSN